jgi:hypothetical protein
MHIKPIWIVFGATVVAAIARFLFLDILPPQIWFDEVWFSWKARALLDLGAFSVYYKTYWGGVHPGFVLLTAVVNALGITGAIATRIVSASAGVLCVPMAYVCFRDFFSDPVTASKRNAYAILVAIILATLLSFVVVSRVGLEWSLAATLTLMCVWLYHRAANTNRQSSIAFWLALGVVLGLSQYLSQHMRFSAPLVAAFALHDFMTQPTQRRTIVAGVVGTIVTSILVVSPLLVFFLREPQWLTARASIIVNPGDQPRALFFLNNTWSVARSLFAFGSTSTLDNVPGRALLDIVQMAGFLAGFIQVIGHVRTSAAARKLLLWLPITAAPSILSEGAPSFERMVNMMPAVAAVVAIGWLWRFDIQPRNAGSRVWPAIATLFIIASCAINLFDYFVVYPRTPKLRNDFTANTTELIQRLVDRSQSQAVFAGRLVEAENMPHQSFFFPGTPVRYLDFRQCMPLTHRRNTPTTYLVSAGDPGALTQLNTAYPTATVRPIPSESSWLIQDMTLIEMPVGATVEITMTTRAAVFAPGMRLVGYHIESTTVRPGESLFITLYWQTDRPIGEGYTAFTHVDSGDPQNPVLAQRDGQPCQGLYPTAAWRQGDLVPDSFAITIPQDAAPGTYAVSIGWYAFPSLERQALINAERALPDNRAWLMDIRVTQ